MTVPAWWRRWCRIRSHLFWWGVAGEARGASRDVVIAIIKRRANAWRQHGSIS